jgi:hypothetical protein
MTFQERTRIVLQFDELIRRKHKADAAGYARKLGISRGSFFRLLSSMRDEFQAPIHYEKASQCYQYTAKGRMHFGFVSEGGDEVRANAGALSPAADAVKQYLQRPGNRQDSSAP